MHSHRVSVALSTLLALSSVPLLAKTPAAVAPGASAACPAIAMAAPDAGAVRTPSAADAWGGPRRTDAATLSDRVVSYSIDAELDPVKHTLRGKQQLTWRNRSAQPVCSVYVHLYLNAFEGPGSTFMTEQRASSSGFRSNVATKDGEYGYIRLDRVAQNGAPARWTFVQPDNGPKTDRSVVRIDLPQPVAPGASTTLDIDFFDQLPRVVARTGYYGSFHLVAQWFPKIGVLELPGERGATAPRWNAHEFHLHSEFYADYGSYDVRITVPKDYTVGATGQLHRHAGRTRRQGHPPLRPARRARLRLDRGQALRQTPGEDLERPTRPGRGQGALHAGIRKQCRAGAAGHHRLAGLLLEDPRPLPVQDCDRGGAAPRRQAKPAGWSTRRSSPPTAPPWWPQAASVAGCWTS